MRSTDPTEWIDAALARFEGEVGRPAELFSLAPGRVNLIGEHTDYSEGLVLPCAIDRHLLAVAARRDDREVRVRATDLGELGAFALDALERRGGFVDYVQGVAFALAEAGLSVGGLDLTLTSRVPVGSGLSSSAALGVAVIGCFDALYDLGLDARARARLVHRGESTFVGVGCGILDQFASALGRADHALRIDCRSQAVRAIPFDGAAHALLIVHAGAHRRLADGAYRDRVRACEAAAQGARAAGIGPPDLRTLRDLRPADLPRLEGVLEPEVFRRARHVISENARVDAFCEAIERGDAGAIGALLAAGQASLRDDFSVSTPELDASCAFAAELPGVIGSRLTGAGFGGCTLHIVERPEAEVVQAALTDGLERRLGRRPESWLVRPAAGASVRRL